MNPAYKQKLQTFSVSEAASLLSCHQDTLRDMIGAGKIRIVDLNEGRTDKEGNPKTRMIRIPVSEIERIVEGRK